MSLPSLPFLRASEAKWKARHTYRTARLALWRRRDSFRYRRWLHHKNTRPEGDPLRARWYRLWQEADRAVDKWLGLRDEASYWLRRRREQQAEHETRASEHFRISEFDCHDGTPVPTLAYQGLRDLCRDVLEPMRARFGECRVTSGYRHRAYNAGIGGAARSYHIYELRGGLEVAADVTFARGNPEQWAAYARALGKGGVGEYATFVHCDNGPVRRWRG